VASKKSRTTFMKVARERELRERRELKQEKKRAARMAKALGVEPPEPAVSDREPVTTEQP
jgi:hypothetical protein